MQETVVDLIRHGQPEGGRRYRGHAIDDPLSEEGWVSMWQAIGEHAPWDIVISSPLQRCHAFALAVANQQDLPLFVETDLKEVGFGHWEGQIPQQIQKNKLAEYEAFYRDPVNCRPEGAEPLDGFIQRVTQAYQHIIQHQAGKHCLVVTHAGVIRVIVAYILQAPPVAMYRMQVSNAGVTRIRHNKYGAQLEFHNGRLS